MFPNHLINQFLARDPMNRAAMQAFEGKVILVSIQKPTMNVLARFEEGEISLSTGHTTDADITISGSASGFLHYLTHGMDNHALRDSGISMMGDPDLILQLNDWMRTLDCDWEGVLAELTGDVFARQVTHHAKGIWRWLKGQKHDATHAFSAYLTDEIQAVPSQEEADAFYDEIKEAQFAVDRLEAKMAEKQGKNA